MRCDSTAFDWVLEAKQIFDVERPENFTDFNHCEECYDHNQTLLGQDIDTISLKELGNIGWDPLCFITPEGARYYMPALIRLSLETMLNECYFTQLLFHLTYAGEKNMFYLACNKAQRQFIHAFIEYVISNYSKQLEFYCSDEEADEALSLWANSAVG